MKKTRILLILLLLPLFIHAYSNNKSRKSAVTVTNPRTELMTSPMSISTTTPRLGWEISSTENDVIQTAFHIIVASSKEKAEALQGDLWDACVQSDQSQWITYNGKILHSNTRCFWRVQVTTNKGISPWSKTAMWNTGLLTENDWGGRWIGLEKAMPWDSETLHSRLSSRYLRHEFKIAKTVKQATLYICGLGLYEAYINGKKIGDQVLSPAPTDYRKTVLYNTFDVTSLLSKKNVIGVALSNGRFYTMQQHTKPYKITNFGYPKMRVNLIIEYTDGTKQTIASDEKWKLNADGPIRSANEYDGEIYDANKELGSWTMPGFADSTWMNAERASIPYGTLRGSMSENMKVVMSLRPVSLKRRGNSVIIDMGQNMAGWLRMKINKAKAGDVIRIRFAEKLQGDTALYVENLRHANSTDYYIANGSEHGRWWSPTFVYHGFRYAEVTGLNHATLDDFFGDVINDNMDVTGTLHTNDSIVNHVFRNAVWGIRSDYKGMPVDCPQRDERQPWLGDRARGCFGEAFIFNNNNLYSKWMRDITEAQRIDGCIPDVAPAYWNYYSDNVTWPSTFPYSLDMLFRQYGNDEPMRTYYPCLTKWLRHLHSEYSVNGIITKDRYGDWCVPPEKPELIHSIDPARITDGSLLSTAYYYDLCRLTAKFAKHLGYASDAAEFNTEAENTKTAFNNKFLQIKKGTSKVPGHILYPDSTFYGNNTVTANILPLTFGMIDDAYVKGEVEKNIIQNIITKNGGHISSGVIGTSWLMHALSDMGRGDVAWLLANNKTYPSWGYMTEHEATTIWELWNGDTANPEMNSANHVMLLGDLVSWLFDDVAGISNDAARPGFKHIIMKPDFSVKDMDDINSSYSSIYGPISSNWKKENGYLKWNVEIPANTTATLYLPDGTTKEIGSGKHDIECKLPLPDSAVITDEFLYKHASFPECHSASIVETKKGDLIATFFGGTKERNPDVCIWTCTKKKGSNEWSKPQMVSDGVFSDTLRKACWNPVLYQVPGGELRDYFKIGVDVAHWVGYLCKSKDGGKTWSKRELLPDSIYGPIKNKPILHNGRLISPTSDERGWWRIYFEYSDDMGKTWKRSAFVEHDSLVRAIQPTIIVLPDGRLEALCRTRNRFVGRTFSSDNGATWSKLELTDVPNNNSGIDAVSLKEGGYVMVCNDYPIEPDKQKGARTPVSLLRSEDGIKWHHWITLEDSPISQYSYPSIIQTSDGLLHVVYTWRRLRIKHVVIKP